MSLALMPDDEWYAPSRTANQQLLDQLRGAAAALQNQPTPEPGNSGKTL
jgi:hypothetical protein